MEAGLEPRPELKKKYAATPRLTRPAAIAQSAPKASVRALLEALTAVSSQTLAGQCALRSSHSAFARNPKYAPAPSAATPVAPAT
jgi:hypothetical protein